MLEIRYEMVQELPVGPIIDLYKDGGWWEDNANNRKIIPAMIRGSLCFIAAFYQNKLIGMGRVISDGASDAYIQDLIVQKEFRGLNIGREIAERLTRYCRERGLDWIGLIAESGTEEFYKSMGFQVLKGSTPMVYCVEKGVQ